MICVVLCKVLQPIALKTKKLRRKVSQIKAQCSCINDGASLITDNCTINSVENGTRFSYDTRGQNPEKNSVFLSRHPLLFLQGLWLHDFNGSFKAKKLFFKLLTIIIMVLDSLTIFREIF